MGSGTGWLLASLLAGLSHPPPVQSLDGFRNADGTITLQWTLPPDPSVLGITIDREDLGDHDLTIFELTAPASSFHDGGARPGHSYRYWVYTRNSAGQLSQGAFIEFFDGDHFEHGHFSCHSSAAGPPAPAGAAATLALAAALLGRRRRGTSGPG